MGVRRIAETTTETELIAEISRVISELTGVQLAKKQHVLVQTRLAKRLRDLKIADPLEYSRYYNANEQSEVGVLTSLLTTHHTFFFREFQHFEYLLKITLPKLIKAHRAKGQKTIRIWSAACSRGQEVFSLVMFLKAHLPQLAPDFDFQVYGSDVCEESIAIAKNAVYPWDELRTVPSVYLQGNWIRGTGDITQYVRAKEDMRRHADFRFVNLLGLAQEPFGPNAPKFDIIFVRNVFIYFNQTQIKNITIDLLKMLNPEGQVFIGLSETLNGLNLPVEWVGPSVYELKNYDAKKKVTPIRPNIDTAVPAALEAPPPVMAPPAGGAVAPELSARKIRVLCVDDSPTVLLLLKKILVPANGFEVVGTAADGFEAAEKARQLKPDIITLDIHMPRVTGVEFLEKNFRELKMPVVVVSSVPRDDAGLAYRCLELGASDYIEKPSMQNMDKVESELLFKLRVAEENWRKANSGPTRSRALELDASFRRPPAILNPNEKLRIIVCNFSSRDVAMVLLKGFRGSQPGTLLLMDGAGDLFKEWVRQEGSKAPGGLATEPRSLKEVVPGAVAFMEMQKGLQMVRSEGASLVKSTLVVGPLNKAMVDGVGLLSSNQLILEDRGAENPQALLHKVHIIVPLTSFVYESDRFFADVSNLRGGGGR